MLIGSAKLQTYLCLFLSIMILSPCFTYYMASIKQKVEPPFPHVTITDTAIHYPQNIPFRFLLLIISSFFSLAFFVIYRWINYQCKKVGYQKRLSLASFLIFEAWIVFYGITLGTIDGEGYGILHAFSALSTFVLWLCSLIKVTTFLTGLRNFDTTVMSSKSLIFKQLIAVQAAIVWIACVTVPLFQLESSYGNDAYFCVWEWNSYFCIAFWILSFMSQWKHFRIGLFKE